MIKCPSGHWCPLGSYEPRKCNVGTICREGTSNKTPIMGLGISIAIDIILIVAFLGVGTWKKVMGRITGRKRAAKQSSGNKLSMQPAKPDMKDKNFLKNETLVGKTAISEVVPDNALSESDIETIQAVDDSEQVMEEPNEELKKLVESFRRCIDGERFGLSFEFQELGLTLQSGQQLLADMNGRIERGSMWGIMGPSGAGKSIH